jgi:hypothetical protein
VGLAGIVTRAVLQADKAPTCPGCGVPILRESKVVVYGYTQQFAINPKVPWAQASLQCEWGCRRD